MTFAARIKELRKNPEELVAKIKVASARKAEGGAKTDF